MIDRWSAVLSIELVAAPLSLSDWKMKKQISNYKVTSNKMSCFVHSGLITNRVKPMTLKLVFTASLLVAQC